MVWHVTVRDIESEHILLAMAEANELGRPKFLERYGFGHATAYLVRHEGKFYDPKAIIGVAHGLTDVGAVLTPNEFDATEAVTRLKALDFEVVPFKGLWWVNQGATYRQEQQGGYVWAPKLTKSGRPVAHHVAVSLLRQGQQIVHYASGVIRAIGYVVKAPESVQKPNELTSDAWEVDGYGCQVSYRTLATPIPRAEVPNRVPTVGPFDVNGDVKQGYLFKVDDDHLFPLLEFLNARVPDLFSQPEGPRADPFAKVSPAMELTADPIHDLLLAAKNVVLEGVPGTGKSFAIERLAHGWEGRTGRQLLPFAGKLFAAQVMHPSSSYEDFIEGLRPTSQPIAGLSGPSMFDVPVRAGGTFVVDDGFFLSVCAAAVANPDKDVLVLIDELNRCNVPSVLGDLLLTLEGSRRAHFVGHKTDTASARDWETAVPVRLPYSGRMFFVPDNVYVVATTNTTDRSVAPLDSAIRRRFAFYRIEPDVEGAVDYARAALPSDRVQALEVSASILGKLNDDALAPCLGPDAMLGPAYLYALTELLKHSPDLSAVSRTWRYNVVPQLVDVTRSYGAEDLLSSATRSEWFAEHGAELLEVSDQARDALDQLDTFLAGLGFRIVVDGTGLARGARVIDATRGRVDIAHSDMGLQTENLEFSEE